MNPVWEHWEQDSIGGKGEKVDAYMCVRCALLCPRFLLCRRYSLDAQPLNEAAPDEDSVRRPLLPHALSRSLSRSLSRFLTSAVRLQSGGSF